MESLIVLKRRDCGGSRRGCLCMCVNNRVSGGGGRES